MLQAANVLRKELRIKVTGPGVPPAPLRTFADVRDKYSCGSRLFANLESLSFPGPTAIQAQAIPALLKGRELLAVAPTGCSLPLRASLKWMFNKRPRKYELFNECMRN